MPGVIPIYKHYLDTDYIAASGFSSGFGFLFNIIVSLIALRFFKSDILYKNLLVVGLIVYVLAGGNLLISRMSAYFMIVMIYILPVSLKNIKTPSLRNILILLIILFFSKDVNRNKFHYKTIFSTDFLIEKFED